MTICSHVHVWIQKIYTVLSVYHVRRMYLVFLRKFIHFFYICETLHLIKVLVLSANGKLKTNYIVI